MITGLMRSSRTRNILHKKALKNNTTVTYCTKFIEYRNKFKISK